MGTSAKHFQVKNIPGSTQRRIFWEVVQEEVGPDPTPRMPWSSDRPKVPWKAKRMENAKDKTKQKKDMGERDKQNKHAYDKVTAKEKEERKYSSTKKSTT